MDPQGADIRECPWCRFTFDVDDSPSVLGGASGIPSALTTSMPRLPNGITCARVRGGTSEGSSGVRSARPHSPAVYRERSPFRAFATVLHVQ